jgi:hypothetical protein
VLKVFYRHDDCPVTPGIEWEDEWECACDGECPACGAGDIVAVDWEEIPDSEHQI